MKVNYCKLCANLQGNLMTGLDQNITFNVIICCCQILALSIQRLKKLPPMNGNNPQPIKLCLVTSK